MIRIKPEPENYFTCPKCSQKPVVREIVMKSVFTLADCACENCGFKFYQTLPISHTIIDPLTICKSAGRLYPRDTKKTWLSEALLKAYSNEKQEEVKIKKIVYEKHSDIVILNAL